MSMKHYTVRIENTDRMIYSCDFRNPESPVLIDGQPTPFHARDFDRLSDGLHADGPLTAIFLNDYLRSTGAERWTKEDDGWVEEEDSRNGLRWEEA